VRELLADLHAENTRWLAELIVSKLVLAAAAGEADEELAAAVNPARLNKLHQRFTSALSTEGGSGNAAGGRASGGGRGRGAGRGRGGSGGGGSGASGGGAGVSFSFASLFPPAQRPYVRLVESVDSHRLASALVRALVSALHFLDPHARPGSASHVPATSRTMSGGDDNGSDSKS
jgi:hypothetical protein